MPYEKAYVFAQNVEGQHSLAGLLYSSGGSGHFEYSPQWLANETAYPLDPVNLPLSSKRYRALNHHGLHGVFRDAAPDDWGTRIMLLRNEHAPANELERLIRTSGGGVGCLRYSLSRERAKTPAPLPEMAHIEALAELASRLDSKQELAPEELALLEPGSSMGGARPKITVKEGHERWLVKFDRTGDAIDTPLLEYCSMQFLQTVIGIRVPETRLIAMGKKHAFAIKRFDEDTHFISANSLFNQDRVRMIEDSKKNPYSYCNLASFIRKHCNHYKEDLEELFTRMVANIVMGNTDDHARNHALQYNIKNKQWALTPAYDMLPIVNTRSRLQAMGVGKMGAQASISNALSYAKLFGLSDDRALQISNHIEGNYRTRWKSFLQERNVSTADIKLITQAALP